MNSNNGDDGLFKLLLLLGAAYAIYRIIEAITKALTALLMGLVYIGLGAAGILALFWVYRYITDKQYGQTKMLREIEKIEREKTLAARLPKPLREDYLRHCKERQEALFNLKNHSRLEAGLNLVKQARSAFGKKGK